MVIRWVPSEVRLVAYYANLMLVSSFLGLGIGAMVASRGWELFRFFAPLLAAYVVFLLLPSLLQALDLAAAAPSFLPLGAGEWRFQLAGSKGYTYLFLALIFVLNSVTFVPLGEEIGRQFHRLPALRAYSWDLGGSLAGTLFFGAFSLLHFSPILGLTLVVLLIAALGRRRHLAWNLPCCAVSLGAILLVGDRGAWWSPYYFITVTELKADLVPGPDGKGVATARRDEPAGPPHADVRTRQDPPVYNVHVNQDFYQSHGTLELERYSPGTGWNLMSKELFAQYSVPYRLTAKRDRVLVLGAGGGMDVQTAILHGAQRVDAVEIDPVIPRISNEYSAAAVYEDPKYKDKIVLHIDDARSFLQNTKDKFDMVVFGFLDSQALFSYGASLRLDGYTYTVESFRRAFGLVNEGGALAVSFYAGRPWMLQKLAHMLEKATGIAPYIYFDKWKAVMVV